MSTSVILNKPLFFIGVLIFLFVSGIKTHAFQQKDTLLVIQDKLKNGMEFTIQEKAKANETLFYFLVKTGSINETDTQLGYAHFLEHMAFNGGKRFKNDSFIQFLKSQGLQIGVNFNATTNYNYTLYEINFPKTISEAILKKTLHFFADILNDLSLNKKAIKVQQKIVLAEKEAAPKIDSLFLFKLGRSKYLDRLPIGNEEDILEITSSKLKRFYKKWYQPHVASLFIAGNISTQKTTDLIKNIFSKIKNTKSIKITKGFFENLNDTVQVSLLKNNKQPKLIVNLAKKHFRETKKERQVRKLVTDVLFKRLDTVFVSKTNIKVSSRHFLADVNYTLIEGNLTTDPLKMLIKILTELKRLAIYGITKEELKGYIIKKNDFKKIESKSNKQYADAWLDVQLDIKNKNTNTDNEIINIEIQRYAEKLWKTSKKIIYIEDSLEVKKSTTTAILKKAVNNVKQQSLKDYLYKKKHKKKEKQKNIQVLKIKNLPLKKPILKRKYDALGVLKLRYKNGVEVFLKPLNTATDQIYVLGYAKGGLSSIPDSLYPELEATSSYMELGGVGQLNYEELDFFLGDKDMGLTQFISEENRTIHGFTTKKEMAQFFKYLYLKMTAARANKKEFKTIVADEIKGLSTAFENRFSMESDFKIAELSGLYYPNRKGASTLSEFKKLNINQMKTWYDTCFSYANDWQFVITGNFTTEQIIPLLNSCFGNLKRKEKSIVNKPLFELNPTDSIYIFTKKNLKNTSITQLYYLPYVSGLKNNLLLSLSERMFRDKITQLLRESLGFVYAPLVSVVKNSLNHTAILKISWQCSPKILNASKSNLKRLLKSIAKEPITISDFNSYKEQLKLEYNTIITSKSADNWGFSLHKILSEKVDIKEFNFYKKTLKNTTINDLRNFLRVNFKEAQKKTVQIVAD